MTKYRGKYPTHIKTIWTAQAFSYQNQGRFARTNDGVLYWIDPAIANLKGMMPQVGRR